MEQQNEEKAERLIDIGHSLKPDMLEVGHEVSLILWRSVNDRRFFSFSDIPAALEVAMLMVTGDSLSRQR